MTTTVTVPRNIATWPVVAVVVLCGIATSLQIGKALVATPLLQADLGLNLSAMGWLTGIFALLGMVGGIPAGTLVARFGDRRMLLLGLVATVVGSIAGALSAYYEGLLVSRIIEGLGFLMITVAAPAVLNRISTPGQRDLALALWSCFMPAGMAIAMLAGPLFDHWRSFWWVGAIVACTSLAAAALLVPSERRGVDRPGRPPAGETLTVLATSGPSLLALCFGLYSLMFFALFSFLPVLLMQRLGMSYTAAGLFSALATASNIAGNLLAGHLLSRGAGRAGLITVACVVMGLAAPCVFLQIFPDTVTLLLCVLFSAVGGMIPATLLSSAPLVAPTPALTPIVIGLAMQGSSLGQVVAPITIGKVIDAYGWASASAVVVAVAIAAVAVSLALGRAFRS